MKTFTKIVALLLLSMAALLFVQTTQGQSVLNPDDPIVSYNATTPPAQPAFGQIGKWARTKRLNWNTDAYKCYIYKSKAFRLMFPKSYKTAPAGTKWPMIIMFHGAGEAGAISDNEFQLYHGGDVHLAAENNGKFDGFVMYMQTGSGWGEPFIGYHTEIIDYMIANNNLDPFRVSVHGLSAGGEGAWIMASSYPKYVSSALPMSNSSASYASDNTFKNNVKFIPVWNFQGGKDGSPDPGTTEQVRDALLAIGANYKYTLYADLGHGTWDRAYGETDFFPFMVRSNKANPWPVFGRSEFCPGDPINITLGVTAGFNAYEWRKDGALISGATSNTINVTTIGTYDCRILRGTTWSSWSPIPVVVKIKTATIPPPVTVSGISSRVIPALDGSTSASLEVPDGYTSYLWQKGTGGATLSTTRFLTATTPGDYRVKVTELYGCSSDFSAPFTVIDANGPNKPDAAINLTISTLSKTSLKLDWSDNPAPAYNETNFEVYQASQPGGPYTMIALTGADILTKTVTGLNANSKYYYKVRAVNLTGAAAASNEANGTTAADSQAPTSPSNLVISGTTRNSITLSWTASTDDVAVTNYDVYVNGKKSYVTQQTSFTVYNLEKGVSYNFSIKARDFANNVSPASNQVTGQPLMNGLNYKHYTFTGTWNNLPDLSTLTPVTTGIMPNVAITPRVQDDNFAFLWEGNIVIPTTGTYYFRTNSDDGSRLWLGALNGTTSPYSFAGTPTVNNDGLHGGQNVNSAALTLTAGIYPIAIAFYEQGGGEAMTVTWRTPSSGTSFVAIPNSVFADPAVNNGVAPVSPDNLKAVTSSYNKITLSWVDKSTTETGFEIWRSSNLASGYTTVGTVAANATTFSDSALTANTRYYYRVRAIGQYGESAFTSNYTEARWLFNGNYNDTSGNGRTLAAISSPVFDAAAGNKMEGSQSIKLNGTSQAITINNTSSFLQEAYSERTVAFWMKSSSNTGNRVVFDIGGSDDGLAVMLNNNTLMAGVVSNNAGRTSISTTYNNANWNHVALVYKGNSLFLYVNGVQAAANTSLSFTAMTTTTNGARIGQTNGTNAFNTAGGFFSGWIDDFGIFNSALSAEAINDLKNNTYNPSNATTNVLPSAPLAPTGIGAVTASSSAINISWTDVANNEDNYELYRSSNNNSNFILLKTLPANTSAYKDSSLFANATYFYKVRAVNVGGPSAYSNEVSATTNATFNNLPVITAIPDQFMRYGTQLQVAVQATDADLESLTFQLSNQPVSYTSFVPNANGGVITFSPTIADQGVVNGITVTVTDARGGSASTSFKLTVNDNYSPVVTSVSNVSLNETQTSQINLSATDQNAGDAITWSFTGLPAFVTPNINGASVQLSLAPGYTDNGVYNVIATATDQNGGFGTSGFVITINDVNPNKKISLDFSDGSIGTPAPWNAINKVPALNDTYTALKDANGVSTTIGLKITSSWQDVGNGTNTYGRNTGNNSGVYPDAVMRTAYFTDSRTQTIQLTGLGTGYKYNFTFFGSRDAVSDDRTSVYTINSTSVSLNAANNSQNTVSINSISPAADGTVTLSLAKGPASAYGYLNAMVIDAVYDDGTVPAKARSLAAQLLNNQISLTWVDAAYNETAYQVYRSTTRSGSYTLLNPAGNNAGLQTYNDPNIIGNTTYFYYVTASNSYGNSPSSDTVSFATPNTAPTIATIADVTLQTQQSLNVNVSATDQVGDVITLTATNLPSFATFTDNHNGTGVVSIAAGSTTGTFTGVTITAKDDKGASASTQFKITVSASGMSSLYVNFNQVTPVGAPWNNLNNLPAPGLTLSNLKNDAGTTTAIGITLVDGWENANDLGATTGNNSGVFPDDVMKTAYYESGTAAKRIRITGLTTPNTKYTLIFFGSRGAVNDNRNTTYSAGGKSVTLNAAGNTSNTVQITGLSPDGSGVLEFTAGKTSTASAYAYINALVIQPYFDSGLPAAPTTLRAVGKSKTTIQLTWTNKADNQTGVEVYRASSLNGAYNLISTLGGSVSTYTDGGLTANTQYWYKVRGVVGATFTDYSNLATGSTLSYQVFVNLNKIEPAGTPWNNTNNVPQDASVYANLVNDQLNPTGLNMTVVGKGFTGDNTLGMNTGNNSGIYPDNVIKSVWWLDAGAVAQLKIDGLNQSYQYNFVFFGSRDGNGQFADRTTAYNVGNKSVSLNCINNTSQTVQVNNIVPDENGSALVEIRAGGASPYGYIGAMVIQGYPLDTTGVPSISGNITDIQTTGLDARVVNVDQAATATTAATALRDNPVIVNAVSAYPNPFTDDVTIKISVEKPVDKMNIVVTDITGRAIYTKQLTNVPQGISQQRLGMNGKSLMKGVYIVQILGMPGEKVRTIKLLK